MSWQRLIVIAIVLLAPGPAFCADEPINPGQPGDDKQVMESKARKGIPVKTVDFRKDLGVPFSSLHTLGSRIDTARQAHDPVSLGHAANELAVAEKVSGKKAAVTSTDLMKEATQLATVRRQVPELQAMLHLNQQIASEQDLVTQLTQQIA